MPKQSVVRNVLRTCLVLALAIGLGSASVAHAQAPGPVPHPTVPSPTPTATPAVCGSIPCTQIGTDSSWCWCPSQQLQFSPGQIDTGLRYADVVAIVNTLPVEVDLVDQNGNVVAAIPSGVTGRLAVPGRGTYEYAVAVPLVVSPPVLTVIALPS